MEMLDSRYATASEAGTDKNVHWLPGKHGCITNGYSLTAPCFDNSSTYESY